MLDISSLEKALTSLKKAFTRSQKNLKDEELRDASIQRFEYTFELVIKMIKRQLKEIESAEEIDKLPYKDLIRVSAEKGLLKNPKEWFDFRNKRNLCLEIYEDEKAKEVYNIIEKFIKNIEYSLLKLKK